MVLHSAPLPMSTAARKLVESISSPFISVLLFVCSRATVYGLWCTVQQAPKAPIISTAHVFEEVEVFQLNAKQDLLGLSPGLRHFIADCVSELAPWKFSPLEIQSDDFPVSHKKSHFFFRKHQQRGSLWAGYRHWCFGCSLVTGHYVHWFPEANHPWGSISCRREE